MVVDGNALGGRPRRNCGTPSSQGFGGCAPCQRPLARPPHAGRRPGRGTRPAGPSRLGPRPFQNTQPPSPWLQGAPRDVNLGATPSLASSCTASALLMPRWMQRSRAQCTCAEGGREEPRAGAVAGRIRRGERERCGGSPAVEGGQLAPPAGPAPRGLAVYQPAGQGGAGAGPAGCAGRAGAKPDPSAVNSVRSPALRRPQSRPWRPARPRLASGARWGSTWLRVGAADDGRRLGPGSLAQAAARCRVGRAGAGRVQAGGGGATTSAGALV